MRIAFIDILGLTYDGNTLSQRGLGGSESAVILLSKSLSKLGFNVTVFNNCLDDHCSPGIYDGVEFIDLTQITDHETDILISSRSTKPFLEERYESLRISAKHKVIWMHDTFIMDGGDRALEPLIVSGAIDEIFTLSDFHTSYVTTCSHGEKRNFEVLKNKIFQTRNGAVKYGPNEVDLNAKDPDLFVFNASVTKGMVPLVERIWPRVKERIPNAKLTIIGGFYRFRSSSGPDDQEKTFQVLLRDSKHKKLDIAFTGVIPQKDIANILKEASFMIYPCAFPETFGISSLESLLYNTPLITCRFGALEETAIDLACYKIDYPIEPNNLFPNINTDKQIDKFVDLVVKAHSDKYLYQQKSNYCSIIKDIVGWDSIALQWKQHLYSKTNEYLPVNEYREVSKINQRVHKIFGRRFSNPEENKIQRNSKQKIINVITPFYNAREYIEDCIDSVASQDYDEYQHFLIDDCSTDDSYDVAENYIKTLPKEVQNRFVLIKNEENKGALYNQIEMMQDIKALSNTWNNIIILLDGDDKLVNDPEIFHFYNNLYHEGYEFTYGSMWSITDNIPLIAQDYPDEVKQNRSYREHKFAWNMPYTHLRTFRLGNLPSRTDLYLDENGEYYRAGGDGALFYAIIENTDPDKVLAVKDIVYVYNDDSPLNDYKVNANEQFKNAQSILKKKENSEVKKILIAIPTARYIEPDTFKSIYDLEVPDGYKTEYQHFYGYNVDQVRNLIADWIVNKDYDYLFSVDHDIVFKPDTLKKLLYHDKDIVSGLYYQRIPGKEILEIYKDAGFDGVAHIEKNDIVSDFMEIKACGFGCVLVKKEVFNKTDLPHFYYKSAIDHKNTISEDIYFCQNARECGFKLYADTTIQCEHIGETRWKVDINTRPNVEPLENKEYERLVNLYEQNLLPYQHRTHLRTMRDAQQIYPNVIYDIGSCVLHWAKPAKNIWPDARIILFEAMPEVEQLYNNLGWQDYTIGPLGNKDKEEIVFYQNTMYPGGNSYYRENPDINPEALKYFPDSSARKMIMRTLDSMVEQYNIPLPDLIKMDVQGAELDILKGAEKTLKSCNHIILEVQKVEYNKGAPQQKEVLDYMKSIGFENWEEFCSHEYDSDWHFWRV